MAKQNATLTVVSADYAWGECPECANTVKFGPGPRSVCASCGADVSADRSQQTVTVDYVPSDDELEERELDALYDLYDD